MLCPDCRRSFRDYKVALAISLGTASGVLPSYRGCREAPGSGSKLAQANSSLEATPKKHSAAEAADGEGLEGAGPGRLPLILVDCGHTLCHACLCNRFQQVALNGGGSWQQASRLSCNKCPECATYIINEQLFQQLEGLGRHEQARIAGIVQSSFPVNRALLNLKKTLAASRPARLRPSPGMRKKRMAWQDQEQREDDDAQEISMILEDEGDRFLEARPGKYSEERAYGDEADDVEEDYQQMEQDFHQIQAQVHQEMQLYEDRQKKMTYLTQQSQDEADELENGSSAYEDEEEDTEQEDVAEEGETDFGQSPTRKGKRRDRMPQRIEDRDERSAQVRSMEEPALGKRKRQEFVKCRIHSKKKIQAFCADCKKVMCINCILDQAHKGHEMMDINEAAQAQRRAFEDGLRIAKANQSELENQILTIRNHIGEIETNAQKQREKIGQIFNEIRQKILEREQLLKKRLSEMLETEQSLYKQRIENLKDQIRCIKDLELEQSKLSHESDLTVLQRCELRGDILADAKKEVAAQRLINCIPKIKKEDELACIVSLILPKKYRAQLLSSKLQNRFRKIQGIESAKRHEFGRQKKEARGGNNLDGSAGSVSHSSLCSGNLLCFPSSRLPHSQSNMRNRYNKDRHARIHKIVLHQRLNSQQHGIQLKKLDNNFAQKSRNDEPHAHGPTEQITLQNMSPNYAPQSRLQNQGQAKEHAGCDRASPTPKRGRVDAKHLAGKLNSFQFPASQHACQGATNASSLLPLVAAHQPSPALVAALPSRPQPPPPAGDTVSDLAARHSLASAAAPGNPAEVFWSQRSQAMAQIQEGPGPGCWQWRGPAGGGQSFQGAGQPGKQQHQQLKTKRANAQMVGLSVVRRLQQKDGQDTARREHQQHQLTGLHHHLHNGSGFGVTSQKLNLTVEQHNLAAVAPMHRGDDKNDEIESMKTQKRGASPGGNHDGDQQAPTAGAAGPEQTTMDNFAGGAFGLGDLSMLPGQHFGGDRAAQDDLQRFAQNDKTIERIEIVKQQLSIDLADQSLLQQIDESEEARDSKAPGARDSRKEQKRSHGRHEAPILQAPTAKAEADIAAKLTHRGAKKGTRNSENKLEPEQKQSKGRISTKMAQSRHISRQQPTQTLGAASQTSESGKPRPKVRKFNQLQYCMAPAITERSGKVEPIDGALLKNDKKGNHELAKILTDVAGKDSARQSRKKKERSGLQSPASQPSPSAPRVPVNIEKLTKTRLLYQDRGYSQGRSSKKNWHKREKEGHSSKRHNFRACPSSQIDLKPSNEKLPSSVTRSNLDRTSDEQARSLSKTRKHWKDRGSIEQPPQERESVSPEAGPQLPTAIMRDGTREGVKHIVLLPSSCSAGPHLQHETGNDKPTLIQETYYKKQHDNCQQPQNQEEDERSEYDTAVPRGVQGQGNDFEIRSQQSSMSGGAKDSRSRGSLNTVQRKQWAKKNSLSKRISDGILHRPAPTVLKQTMQESPISLKSCVQGQKNEEQSSSNHPDIRICVPEACHQPAPATVTSKTSLYQMILQHNNYPKQGPAGQAASNIDAHQRRKALQHSQSGPNAAVRPAKKSKSSLNKGPKTIGDATTLDAQNSGILSGTMSYQRGTGATSKTGSHLVDKSGKSSAANIYQQTAVVNQSAFQNTQLATSFQQQPMSAHSQGPLQNKALLPCKAKSRTAARSNQQTGGSLATRQSQRKKKKNPKSKKEAKDLLKVSANEQLQSTQDGQQHGPQGGDREPEAAPLLPSGKSRRQHSRKTNRNGTAAATSSETKQKSDRKQLEDLKDKIGDEGKIEHYQTLVPPEAGSDGDYEDEKALATVRELFEQTEQKAVEAAEMAGSQMELADVSGNQQKLAARVQQSSDEDSCDHDEEESVGEGEMEVRSAGRAAASPHRRELDDPLRRLRSGELSQPKHCADKLYSAATKCKSPEPIQHIEILRRFELTSPKKFLRGPGPRGDRPKTMTCKTIPRKKMDSRKLCMVDANDGESEALEGCEEVAEIGAKHGTRTSLQQTVPLKNNLVILVDPSPSTKSKRVDCKFEQKARSKSSQIQEVPSRGCSTHQKKPSGEYSAQARDQGELSVAARPVSRYSSCDFQVDDDERTDTPHHQNQQQTISMQQRLEVQVDSSKDDQIANEPNPPDHRAKMKTIHQSSYSIAQMQPMRYQKKKASYEQNHGTNIEGSTAEQQPPQHEATVAAGQIQGPTDERRDQKEKAQGASGQQPIKKSIQKKLIRELGVDKERNEEGRGDLVGDCHLANGARSNRSIGKPFLRIAEPTRAHSPLSAYSNISSSHSSKYQSVKIAPKDFGASLHASKPSAAVDQVLSPSARSKVKKLAVKSFLHCSSLSQLNPSLTSGVPQAPKPQPLQAPSILPHHDRHPSQGSLLEILNQTNQPAGQGHTSPSHQREANLGTAAPLQIVSPLGSPRPDHGGNPDATIGTNGENLTQRAELGRSGSRQQKENDSQHFNPVEAAIAQVKMRKSRQNAGQSDHQHSDQKMNSSRHTTTILDHGSNHKIFEDGGRNHAGSSGKKRSRKIRKLLSIPSMQARSRTSLPPECLLPTQILDKPLTPIKMSQFANLDNCLKALPEAANLPTAGAEFAASMVSAQSKSDLYRVKEEFFFIFGGIGAPKGPADKQARSAKSIEVMDVSREICREFIFNNEGALNADDEHSQQRPKEASPVKIIGKEGKDCFPIHGFRAIQFKLDKQYAKKLQISKFEDRIYLIGGQNEEGRVLDQVHEYSVNDMNTLFKADWKLPHDLSGFAVTQGSVRRHDLSQSIFIAGGLKSLSQKERMVAPIKSVYRLFLDKSEASPESLVLGTDMTTGLEFKCEILPEMNAPRSQFSLVFNSLNNQQDYELYAIGGIDDNLAANADVYAIERYSSRTREWKALELKSEGDLKRLPAGVSSYISSLKGHQSVLLPDGSIYIIGGCSAYSRALTKHGGQDACPAALTYTSSLLRFDSESHSISSSALPSMNQPRGFFSAILSQNLRYIYVLGGLTNAAATPASPSDPPTECPPAASSPLDSIEKYDTFSQKWQLVAPMKTSRGLHAVCQMIM